MSAAQTTAHPHGTTADHALCDPEQKAASFAARNKRALWVRPLKTALLSATPLALALSACATSEPSADDAEGLALGKADVTVGPIKELSCAAERSFVRRGGFVSFKVDAFDDTGAKSRNYTLEAEPSLGARVVQRDQVIFDVDGLYKVRCCSLDAPASSPMCDEVPVRVGAADPALSVSVSPFSVAEALLKGQALDQTGAPARVLVDGREVPTDEQGRFELTTEAKRGLNRFEVVAEGEGGWTLRRAWTVGGPFHEVGELNPSIARLRLSPQAYPQLSTLLKALLMGEVERYASGEAFKQTQSGSSLGYEWEVTPTRLEIDDPQLTLSEGARQGELSLSLNLKGFKVFADGQTRFTGDWRARDVLLGANLSFEVPLTPHAEGIDVGEVRVGVDALNIEISDMPGFFEGVLEWLFEDRLEEQLTSVVERVGERGLSKALMGFEVSEQLELPAPLNASLDLTGRLLELNAGPEGVTLGLGLSINGESDPARANAPGVVMSSAQNPELLGGATPYELSLHVDLINRLLFAAWQTGGLDFMHEIERPLGEDEEDFWQSERLTVFVTPSLPPVARLGERSGEVLIELGALKVDAILEGELAVLNCALETGASLRALLSGGDEQLNVSASVDRIEADVLIAPGGWEQEPTRRLIERLIQEDIAPKYAELLRALPLPTADLRELGVRGLERLSIRDLTLRTPAHSLSVSASLELK